MTRQPRLHIELAGAGVGAVDLQIDTGNVASPEFHYGRGNFVVEDKQGSSLRLEPFTENTAFRSAPGGAVFAADPWGTAVERWHDGGYVALWGGWRSLLERGRLIDESPAPLLSELIELTGGVLPVADAGKISEPQRPESLHGVLPHGWELIVDVPIVMGSVSGRLARVHWGRTSS